MEHSRRRGWKQSQKRHSRPWPHVLPLTSSIKKDGKWSILGLFSLWSHLPGFLVLVPYAQSSISGSFAALHRQTHTRRHTNLLYQSTRTAGSLDMDDYLPVNPSRGTHTHTQTHRLSSSSSSKRVCPAVLRRNMSERYRDRWKDSRVLEGKNANMQSDSWKQKQSDSMCHC